MARLDCDLPSSLMHQLTGKAAAEGRSLASLVREALASYLDVPLHTLFQVSTR